MINKLHVKYEGTEDVAIDESFIKYVFVGIDEKAKTIVSQAACQDSTAGDIMNMLTTVTQVRNEMVNMIAAQTDTSPEVIIELIDNASEKLLEEMKDQGIKKIEEADEKLYN